MTIVLISGYWAGAYLVAIGSRAWFGGKEVGVPSRIGRYVPAESPGIPRCRWSAEVCWRHLSRQLILNSHVYLHLLLVNSGGSQH
jgi:hypothetical protein